MDTESKAEFYKRIDRDTEVWAYRNNDDGVRRLLDERDRLRQIAAQLAEVLEMCVPHQLEPIATMARMRAHAALTAYRETVKP